MGHYHPLMTGYVVNTGSNENYAEGWDAVFGGKNAAKTSAKKKSPAKKTVKKKAVKKTAKKNAAKKTAKKKSS